MSMCLSSLAAAGEALVHRLRAVAAVLVVCRKQPASPWMSLVLVAAVFTRSQWAVAAQQEAPIRPCRGRVPIRCLMLAGHRPLQRAVVAAATRNTAVASLAAGRVVLVAAVARNWDERFDPPSRSFEPGEAVRWVCSQSFQCFCWRLYDFVIQFVILCLSSVSSRRVPS